MTTQNRRTRRFPELAPVFAEDARALARVGIRLNGASAAEEHRANCIEFVRQFVTRDSCSLRTLDGTPTVSIGALREALPVAMRDARRRGDEEGLRVLERLRDDLREDERKRRIRARKWRESDRKWRAAFIAVNRRFEEQGGDRR